VPGKNVRHLAGKPAIAYTIEAALRSGLFDRVVVSTDSAEIAEIANQHGAETPFLRESSLADDHTPVSCVTVDALKRLDPEGRVFNYVAQLMANCPLRTHVDVRNSYRQFIAMGGDSQVSVTRYSWQNPWWAMRRTGTFELRPIFEELVRQRSQDLEELFCPTGAIWWAGADVLRKEGTYHTANRKGWEIAWQHGIDIDTEEDWWLAEFLLRSSALQKNSYGT
jgi:N-acylneuraminate cytidylyltransferase